MLLRAFSVATLLTHLVHPAEDVASAGGESISAMRGNPACWHSIYSFDYCCGSQYGRMGNRECWDRTYSYAYCCLESYDRSGCLVDARKFLAASGDPVAQHPLLKHDHNLEKFCCFASAYSSQVCWGAGKPEGSPFVRDSLDGHPLNFTQRYAECCFPRLRSLIESEEKTDWIEQQLDHDFAEWEPKGPYSIGDLDEFEAAMEEAGMGGTFCRFRIRHGGIGHCDFERSGYKSMLEALQIALHLLQIAGNLPSMDFLVHAEEGFGIFDGEHKGVAVPVLVQAQLDGLSGILMPWWAFLQLDWTRLYEERMQKFRDERPWDEREAKLFWRGSDTGCLLEDSCNDKGCACENWTVNNWALFPRSRLVLSGMLAPDRIDALYTKNVVHETCAATYGSTKLWIDEIVPPEKHVNFKYLMYIDGLSFSDRLYWLMQAESLVFRSGSQLRVWIDKGLQPWVHYVPVAENLTDIFKRLDWARDHDWHSSVIASQGTNFALQNMTLDATLYYLYRLLRRLARTAGSADDLFEENVDFSFSAVDGKTLDDTAYLEDLQSSRSQQMSPQSEERTRAIAEAAAAGDISCWAMGFTPEFCCNVDQFGLDGNSACWDGPYTFNTCCFGPLGTLKFWRQLERQGHALQA